MLWVDRDFSGREPGNARRSFAGRTLERKKKDSVSFGFVRGRSGFVCGYQVSEDGAAEPSRPRATWHDRLPGGVVIPRQVRGHPSDGRRSRCGGRLAYQAAGAGHRPRQTTASGGWLRDAGPPAKGEAVGPLRIGRRQRLATLFATQTFGVASAAVVAVASRCGYVAAAR